MKTTLTFLSSALLASLASPAAWAQKPLKFKDVFDFKYAKNTQLSDDGKILSFSAKPYRGNANGQVYDLTTNTLISTVERGTKPVINKAANWVAFTQVPTLLEQETSEKKSSLKNNLILVNTQTGEKQQFADVKDYVLGNNGQWLAYRVDKKAEKDTPTEDNSEEKSAITPDKKDKSFELVIINLKNSTTHSLNNVFSYALSSSGAQLIASQSFSDGNNNQLVLLELNNNFAQSVLIDEPGVVAQSISWHPDKEIAAFNLGNYVNDDERRRQYSLKLWQNNTLSTIDSPNKEWVNR